MFLPSILASLICSFSPFPSVVYLRADPDGIGAGWVVDADKKLILTSRHVVGDQATLQVFFPVFRDGRLLANSADYLGRQVKRRESGTLVTGKVLRTSDELDLALIAVPSLPRGTRALAIADARPSLGQSIWSIGHRGDVDTLWNATTGVVRQRGRLADGYFWQSKKLAAELPCLVLQSPIEEGDSGGPVLNARGEVIAMISALRRRTPLTAVGPDASAIRTFLKRTEPPPNAESSIAEGIARSAVWIRPTATDVRCAGVLVDCGRRFVLTSAVGVGPFDRVGVAFPMLGKTGEIVAESAAYKDGVELHLAKRWHVGTVLHRDFRRDLALVKLDSIPGGVKAVSLAEHDPAMLENVFAITHPMGLEFAFVASSGALRQRGSTALERTETSPKPMVNLFQLPALGSSPGGPICNGRGELLGVQAAKDGPLHQCYAASLAEVRAFLAEAPGAISMANATTFWRGVNTWDKFVGWALFGRAQRPAAVGVAPPPPGWPLRHHPDCVPALLTEALRHVDNRNWPAVIAACDGILLQHPQHREALLLRATGRRESKQPKPAIGDLQRWLDIVPGDITFRAALAKCYESSGDAAKAAEELKKLERLQAVPK